MMFEIWSNWFHERKNNKAHTSNSKIAVPQTRVGFLIPLECFAYIRATSGPFRQIWWKIYLKRFCKIFHRICELRTRIVQTRVKTYTNLEFTVVDLKSKNYHRIEFIESCRMIPASFFWSCFVLIILVDWPFLLWMWMSTHHIRYLLANMNSFIKF